MIGSQIPGALVGQAAAYARLAGRLSSFLSSPLSFSSTPPLADTRLAGAPAVPPAPLARGRRRSSTPWVSSQELSSRAELCEWPPGSHPWAGEREAGRSGGCRLGSSSSSSRRRVTALPGKGRRRFPPRYSESTKACPQGRRLLCSYQLPAGISGAS